MFRRRHPEVVFLLETKCYGTVARALVTLLRVGRARWSPREGDETLSVDHTTDHGGSD